MHHADGARTAAEPRAITRIPLGGTDPVVSVVALTRMPCTPAGATGDTGEYLLRVEGISYRIWNS